MGCAKSSILASRCAEFGKIMTSSPKSIVSGIGYLDENDAGKCIDSRKVFADISKGIKTEKSRSSMSGFPCFKRNMTKMS